MSEKTQQVEKPKVQIVPEPEVQLPSLNLNMQQPLAQKSEEEKQVISTDEMQNLYKELLSYCRDDRKDADEGFRTLFDMAINEGDASASTKEAMVQFLRIKVEATDKMAKVMDLLMRSVLRERDTFPRYLAAHQENNLIFKNSGGKRGFLEKVEKMKQLRKEDGK